MGRNFKIQNHRILDIKTRDILLIKPIYKLWKMVQWRHPVLNFMFRFRQQWSFWAYLCRCQRWAILTPSPEPVLNFYQFGARVGIGIRQEGSLQCQVVFFLTPVPGTWFVIFFGHCVWWYFWVLLYYSGSLKNMGTEFLLSNKWYYSKMLSDTVSKKILQTAPWGLH